MTQNKNDLTLEHINSKENKSCQILKTLTEITWMVKTIFEDQMQRIFTNLTAEDKFASR